MDEISEIGAVRSLVTQLLKRDICDVVLSPGSRNAPFILSFAGIKAFRCQSVLDERTAAFVALGIAQQRSQPVILSCTSGSAVVNYAPALAEAYYQRIPLIVITADRPQAWIDQGEGQSIRQVGALDNVVAGCYNLVEERTEIDQWHNHRLINEAIERCTFSMRPVQINVPLSEPLYGTVELAAIQTRTTRWIKPDKSVNADDAKTLVDGWNTARRIVILVTGQSCDQRTTEALKRLYNDPRVALITETNANVYLMGAISCIDRTLEAFLGTDEAAQYVPDLLITIGGNVISKKIKALFRAHRDLIKQHWHFGDEVMDTFQSLTWLVDVPPAKVLTLMEPTVDTEEDAFGVKWKARFFEMEQRHHEYLEKTKFSDLKVFEAILDWIPDHANLQMGNSSVVRYFQLFNQVQHITYFGNRGVSGIEGCTSTAVGAAQASGGLTVLVSGDQAFRYDANALMLAKDMDNLRIIVVNNEGGNIFRIIDGPENNTTHEAYIEKHDPSSVKGLAVCHQLNYLSASTIEEVHEMLERLFDHDTEGCTVLEIFTPRKESPEVLKAYLRHLGSRRG